MLSTSSCRCVADFAILELWEAVNDIELAVLAEESPKTGDAVTVMGWGATRGPPRSYRRRRAEADGPRGHPAFRLRPSSEGGR